MTEVDHSATSSYQRSDLDLPGPKYESSPTSQLPKGPTFTALASGGVHTVGDLLFGEAGHINVTRMSASCQ
jgi:hypothetical protein